MLRQFSGGNNRYRGLKPKDALHISLILAVSIWILYHLTYTYQNNSIIDSYMQFNVHQEYKIKQERTPDLSGDPAIDTIKTKNVVDFVKEERKVVDKMGDDTGNSADAVNENVIIGKEGEIEKRIKEHEARERSFKDDDVSSSVLHDYQTPETKEESTTEITTHLRSENMTNGDNKFDFILGNGTINSTALEKNISNLGNFSIKPDGIKGAGKN
jgi:hypothetical protein